MISNWDRGINIDAAKAKIRNVGLVVIHDRADFPVYDDISTVPNPTEGTRVHCTGKGPQKPAGEWWFDGDKWFSGTRTRVSAQQQKVTANNSVILQEFGLPSNTEINVWQLQATNISGSNTGISIDVRNTTDGNEIAVYDAASEDGTVKIGTPIATGGDGDDIIVVRVVNTTGSAKDVTGFAVISIQSIV